MSPDRIDSGNKTYDASNVHLVHVGCNLAKNVVSLDEWQEYLDVARSVRGSE